MALVIDAHHHFWDPAKATYPWMTDALAPIHALDSRAARTLEPAVMFDAIRGAEPRRDDDDE